MANQRGTFAKRDRELKLKERARAKAERRMARKAEKLNPQRTDDDDAAVPSSAAPSPAPQDTTPLPVPPGTGPLR